MKKIFMILIFLSACSHNMKGPFCNKQIEDLAPVVYVKDVVFHGSLVGFSGAPRASYSTRTEDKYDKPVWADTAVFASHDARIALSYTAAADIPGYAAGVELGVEKKSDEPLILAIYGGESKEQALSVLFGPDNNCHLYFRPGICIL